MSDGMADATRPQNPTPSKSGGKTADGRFAKGNKAGRGRPAGSRNKATLIAQALLDGEAEELIRKCVELAKGGDTTALRLCLERLLPPRKERPVEVDVPPIEKPEDAVKAMTAITAAVARGDLTPGEGQSLAAILEAHRKTVEVADLDRRLTELERQRGMRK